MPASPSSVSTACSMRPFGRPRRRVVEEPDVRDIVSLRIVGRTDAPELQRPEKHDAGPGGSASAMNSRVYRSTRYLAYASGSPQSTGGDGGAGGANGYAACGITKWPTQSLSTALPPAAPPARMCD